MIPLAAAPDSYGQPVPPLQLAAMQQPAARRGHSRLANAAADLIEQHYNGARRGTALAIYSALTILASRQRTPERVCAATATIAATAGYKEAAARRYLHEFADLGLLRVEVRNHAANIYHLMPPVEMVGWSDAPPSPAAQQPASPTKQRNSKLPPTSRAAEPQARPFSVQVVPQTLRPAATRGGSDVIPLVADASGVGIVEGDPGRSPTKEVKSKEENNNKANAVVVLVDDELGRRLKLIGISRRMAGILIAAHGSQQVREVLAEAQQRGQRPAAWLIAALRDGYDVRPVQRRGGEEWVAAEAERLCQQQPDNPNLTAASPDLPATNLPAATPVEPPNYKPPSEAARALWYWTVEDASRQLPHLKGWLTAARLVGMAGLTLYVHTPVRHLLGNYTAELERLATQKLGKLLQVVWV